MVKDRDWQAYEDGEDDEALLCIECGKGITATDIEKLNLDPLALPTEPFQCYACARQIQFKESLPRCHNCKHQIWVELAPYCKKIGWPINDSALDNCCPMHERK